MNVPENLKEQELEHAELVFYLPKDWNLKSGDEKHEPFAENTKLNTIMLVNASNLLYEKLDLRLSSGKKINFYQMFPIYQEELEYKTKHSFGELLDLFSDEDLFPLLNISRKNYGID